MRREVIGNCELYLGDCFEILPILGSMGAIVTDPPYGINVGKMNLGFSRSSRIEKSDWDKIAPDLSPLVELNLPTIIWGGNYFPLPINKGWLVWDKGGRMKGRSFAECELAWSNLKINAKTFMYNAVNNDCRDKIHHAQKPVMVMKWCLSLLPEECSTICDPFMGSGTTGLACIDKGLRFIGIEINEKYFDIACERIQIATRQGRFDFGGTT